MAAKMERNDVNNWTTSPEKKRANKIADTPTLDTHEQSPHANIDDSNKDMYGS